MSRNPFLDLGVLSEEATILQIRSHLAALLEQHIGRKAWSLAAASRALRVARITIRKIVNGKLEKLPIELLIKLLARAGLNVEISVSRGALGPRYRRRLIPKMTQRQLIARDSKRDLGAELLQAARQVKAGHAARTWRVSTNRKTLVLEDDFGRRFVRRKGKVPRVPPARTRRATSRARMKEVKK
jgi:predicted XRE-type DNA-binding protein